jgi:hypothetical protein
MGGSLVGARRVAKRWKSGYEWPLFVSSVPTHFVHYTHYLGPPQKRGVVGLMSFAPRNKWTRIPLPDQSILERGCLAREWLLCHNGPLYRKNKFQPPEQDCK